MMGHLVFWLSAAAAALAGHIIVGKTRQLNDV
jgi:hypothetical protein